MNERLKQVRKLLEMSQEEFGEKLGVTKAAISRLESGVNNLTEQTIKLICKEFGVDYRWLTSGEGDMFVKEDDTVTALIDRVMAGEDEFAKAMLKGFAAFSDEDWFMLRTIIGKFLSGLSVEEVQEFVLKETGIEVNTSTEPKEGTKKEADL